MEAFPTSLSVVHLAGLERELDGETIERLRTIELQFSETVSVTPILRARTTTTLENAFIREYRAVVGYYIESGILVYRSLNSGYGKLLRLSQSSCAKIDDLCF